MKVVGSAHDNGVEILLLVQKLAEVRVCGAAVILSRTFLRSVITLDDFLAGFAAGDTTGNAKRVSQLYGLVRAEPIPTTINAEQIANRLAELVGVPLRISRATLIHVANGNPLHVRLAEEMQHDAQALRTDTDESDVDAIARRNESRSP